MTEQDHQTSGATASSPGAGAVADQGCADAVARLYEYLDGELDEDTVARVEIHLTECSPCLETFDFHADLRRVIRSKCSESMPAEVRSKLLAMFSDPES